MEIKNLSLDGFLSYYKETCISFSEGTTVIIGKNNTGKSKLFDAFHFVLFNRVFDSQMEVWIDNFESVANAVLNNKRRKEAIEQKKKVEVSVSLEMESEDYLNSIIYIDRKIEYDFTLSEKPVLNQMFTVSIQDMILGDTKVYRDIDAEAMVLELFPSCLRDFILFQGEAASELMKLSKKNQSTIEKAIRQVARLELFEKAAEIASSYAKTKYGSISRKKTANDKVSMEIEKLQKEIEEFEKKNKELDDKENANKEKIDSLKNSVIKYEEELGQQNELSNLFNQRDELVKRQKELKKQIDEFKEINHDISDTWVFYKVLDKIKSFSEFYEKLELIGQVPAPISQNEIKKSLNQHCCTLCGCTLEEGTDLFYNVKKKVRNDALDSLGELMRNLNFAFATKVEEVNRVPIVIEEYQESKKQSEKQRKYFKQQFDDVNNKIRNISISENDEKKKIEIENKRNIYLTTKKLLEKANKEYQSAIDQKQVYQNLISERYNKILLVQKQSGNISTIDNVKVYYSKKMSDCMQRLCFAAQELAYNEIQNTSNELYHDMMKENPAIVGDIRIDRNNSEIYTENSFGDKITNLNTGSRITIQLAVISGILSVAASQFGSFFPFITDAPTSKLDSVNKMQVIKCMIRAFEQSIIIVKDDSDNDVEKDPLRKLVSDTNDIGTAYELSLYRENNSTDIDDQYTVVSIIKKEN